MIKRLQDGQSSFLQAPSQDTCAYFQRSGEVASAPFPCAAKFPSKRAAHYSRLFRFVNTFFQGRLTGVDVVADAASSLDPRVFRRCEPPIMAGLSALSTTCLRNLKLFVKLLPQVQVETGCLQKKENPAAHAAGFSGINPGDDLLSHGLSHTTIGAAAFHFRVRDGIGWFHSANFTREAVGASPSDTTG